MPAGTISQRIALEGADDIIQKLQAVGLTGEEAFKKLQNATSTVGKGLAEVPAAFDKFKTGITNIAGEAQKLIGSFSGFGAAAGAVSTVAARFGPLGIAAAAVGGGLLEIVKSASDAVVANQRMAAALGLTIGQYKGLKVAAHEAGASTEELNTGLRRFSTQAAAEGQSQFKGLIDLSKQLSTTLPGGTVKFANLADLQKLRDLVGQVAPQIKAQFEAIGDPLGKLPIAAFTQKLFDAARQSEAVRKTLQEATGGDAATSRFEKLDQLVIKNEASFKGLGISLLDAQGKARSTFDVFLEAGKKIGGMTDGIEKTATASKLFGREAGPALLPLFDSFAKGETTAASLQAKFKEVNASMVADAAAAKKAFDQLGETWDETRTKLAIGFAPVASTFVSDLTKGIEDSKRQIEELIALWERAKGVFSSGSLPGLGGGLTSIGQGAGGSKPEDNNAGLPDATLLGGASGGLVNVIRGLQSGGRISGAGTGTSDSIVARLSHGEYVSDARTVSRLGPQFFAGLKNMAAGGFIGDMFELPRFALGGSIPSFAGGGMAGGGGSPVHIHFPDGNKFTTHASASVADSLGRYSVHKQLSRAGRSPSWAGL